MNTKTKKATPKPKRARTAKGHFKADDKSTPHINEAYEQPKYTSKDYIIFIAIVGGAIAFLIFN